MNIRYRPSAFEQSIDTLRALWNGESVTLDGRWKFNNAGISPLPPTPIKIWIGASAEVAIERAAKIGDAWLADPSQTLQQAEDSMEIYQQALQKHARPVPDTIAIRKDIYVAASQDEANLVRQQAAEKGYRGFNTEALIIGDIMQVADQFQQLGNLGYTDIIVRNLQTDQDKAISSISRLAQVRSILVECPV